MSDLPLFKSSLSIKEIENNFKDFNFFEELVKSLEEATLHREVSSKDEIVTMIVKQSFLKDILTLVNNQKVEIEKLKKFKSYFDGLYGYGLEVINWHLNGELEPFDNFYDSAIQEMENKDNV